MNLSKKVAFYTLGCKVNQYETESLKNTLVNLGYEDVDFEEFADYYVVNSCTVTSVADKKTRNILRRAKKNNPSSKVVVTGCYAQTNSEELLAIEEVDYAIGNSNKNGVVDLIQELERGKTSHFVVTNIFDEDKYEELGFAVLREMTRAYIKIQDGCNNFCSYCKIPFGRGKSRSRSFENILEESKKLAEEGYKEIILIGINLGEYGLDLEGNLSLEGLLEELAKIEKISRIRVGSIYPDRITERFVTVMKNEKIMPHLHISLQSCDDSVLKNMRRNYGKALIEEKLNMLRKEVEDIEYTADVIVGFPGETEEMFKNTMESIEELGFSGLHVFPYSERENTLAASFKNQIPMKERKERVIRLEEVQKEKEKEIKESYIGKEMKILIEEEKEGYYLGYSENYLRVKIIKRDVRERNNELKVKIISVNKEMLIGEY